MAEMDKKSYESDAFGGTNQFMSGTLGATGASQFPMNDTKPLGASTGPIFLSKENTN